ncbi:MAG: response regulator [Xanthomonadaceae bacterium]|nr:response regulator [Xanthomonadaceae bacterium]
MSGTPCILLCEASHDGQHPLATQLRRAGIQVELAGNVVEARRLLRRQFYDGVAIDLLLPDQDGISLALDIRRQYADLPLMVLTTRQRKLRQSQQAPDWLDKTANQARLVFALKQASQRAAGWRPRVLQVDDDDEQARLVRDTLGHQARLVRTRDAQETELALLRGEYDLALINMDSGESLHNHALQLLESRPANLPLVLNTAAGSDPMIPILWALIAHYDEPVRAAYC